MAAAETYDIQIASRVSKSLYDKIIRRQQKAKELTGIEPSVSEVVRAMVAEAARNDDALPSGKRRNGR